MNLIEELRGLIQLALVDNSFDEAERSFIMKLGEIYNLPSAKIKEMIEEELTNKELGGLNFHVFDTNQKMEYLVNMIRLMKADGEVYLSEIRFCEKAAEKMGFNKKIVRLLSGKIHGDINLNPNWNTLRKEMELLMVA